MLSAGKELVDLLGDVSGAHVLDLGCGTGRLTAVIADRGARVVGLDRDPEMIDQARCERPDLCFELADGHDFTLTQPVDIVFSNAVLHWLLRPDSALDSVRRALRPGGRFVAEMCVRGSLATPLRLLREAAADLGLSTDPPLPWYLPTPREYEEILLDSGFEVTSTRLFERPMPIPPELGITGWWRTYGALVLAQYPAAMVEPLLSRITELCPANVEREGFWLRFTAQNQFDDTTR